MSLTAQGLVDLVGFWAAGPCAGTPPHVGHQAWQNASVLSCTAESEVLLCGLPCPCHVCSCVWVASACPAAPPPHTAPLVSGHKRVGRCSALHRQWHQQTCHCCMVNAHSLLGCRGCRGTDVCGRGGLMRGFVILCARSGSFCVGTSACCPLSTYSCGTGSSVSCWWVHWARAGIALGGFSKAAGHLRPRGRLAFEFEYTNTRHPPSSPSPSPSALCRAHSNTPLAMCPSSLLLPSWVPLSPVTAMRQL